MSWYSDNNILASESVGIDEVGRGPLAGPVVAAAVWICDDFATVAQKKFPQFTIRDSKKMTSRRRALVNEWVKQLPREILRYSIASATVEEIDRLNILNAALLAMKRAHESLDVPAKYAIVDGNRAPDLQNCAVKTVIGGDDKVLAISVASIIAKEHRDVLMRSLAQEFPHYGWDKNVGYGTRAHLEAIEKYGISPHHRRSFAPISALLEGIPTQKSLAFG